MSEHAPIEYHYFTWPPEDYVFVFQPLLVRHRYTGPHDFTRLLEDVLLQQCKGKLSSGTPTTTSGPTQDAKNGDQP